MTEAPAIPAATLILVREAGNGRPPELLMVERASTMAFAAGALVFPGGRIDPADHQLGDALGVEHGDAIVAAVRETLEETAVPVALDPMPSPELAQMLQHELLEETPLAVLLDRHRLSVRPAALTLFAHWVPKFHAIRRFDTRFFLAAAPAGDWQPRVGERENQSAEWLSAAEVLRRESAGEASLIFPTRCNLQRLAQHDSIRAMRDDAARHPVEPISPWVEHRHGERLLTIPAHLGYPVTQEPLDSLWRG
ncbi:MAG: NUDIX domain-containing protein [Sphingomicrobium sp.]|nr:NUDIX domain-containing protein [Sphingomonadales bacterium]